MANLEIIKLIPEQMRQRQLFDKVVEILQNFDDEERQQFNDIVLKYKDPKSINKEAAREVISELGFDYIVEIVEILTEEELGTLVSYIGFISLIKGTELGLKTIFDLLGFSYEITEWWEYSKDRRKGQEPDAPLLEVDEWKLVIDILLSPNLDNIFYTVPKLHTFARNYVYPLLAYLELVFRGVIDNINASIHGTTDELINSDPFMDWYKIIGLYGTTDSEYFKLHEEPEPEYTLFDDLILTENDFYIYTEDNKLIKLEN